MKHLEKVVGEYEAKCKKELNKYLNFYRKLPSLNKIIEKATLAIINREGEKHSHQRRIKKGVLEKVKNKLLDKKHEISKCQNFDDIHKIVLKNKVKGFGPLATYDTALRIGVKLKERPQKVNLHAGASKGYEALCKAFGIKKSKQEVITKKELPLPVQKLEPYRIEDFLCICKDKFQKGKKSKNKCVRKPKICC